MSQIITAVGLAKIAAALAGGPALVITEVALGDAATVLDPALLALGNEVWRGPVNAVTATASPDRVLVEGIAAPGDAIGFTLREAAAFDSDGDMVLIARIPDTYKPDPAVDAGSTTLYLRMAVEILNAETALSLTVDMTTVLATRAQVDEIDGRLTGHLDGAASKHDATEIDYEQLGLPNRVRWTGFVTDVQALLDLAARVMPVAVGIFTLEDAAEALIHGAGWDAVLPIAPLGGRRYELKLSNPLHSTMAPYGLDITGLTVVATVGGHGAFQGLYAHEVSPLSLRRAADGTFVIRVATPEAHAAGDPDGGPADPGAPAAADECVLHVVVYNSANLLSGLPALVVTP